MNQIEYDERATHLYLMVKIGTLKRIEGKASYIKANEQYSF